MSEQQRDELALVLANAQRVRNGSSMLPSADHVSRLALDDADAVLAAGYSKPRTITTAEELDALDGSEAILRSRGGDGFQWGADFMGRSGWFMHGTMDPLTNTQVMRFAPFTVIHEGASK